MRSCTGATGIWLNTDLEWKEVTNINNIPSTAKEMKVRVYESENTGYVFENTFILSDLSDEWKWYLVGSFYRSSTYNAEVVIQLCNSEKRVPIARFNGELTEITNAYYWYR